MTVCGVRGATVYSVPSCVQLGSRHRMCRPACADTGIQRPVTHLAPQPARWHRRQGHSSAAALHALETPAASHAAALDGPSAAPRRPTPGPASRAPPRHTPDHRARTADGAARTPTSPGPPTMGGGAWAAARFGRTGGDQALGGAADAGLRGRHGAVAVQFSSVQRDRGHSAGGPPRVGRIVPESLCQGRGEELEDLRLGGLGLWFHAGQGEERVLCSRVFGKPHGGPCLA